MAWMSALDKQRISLVWRDGPERGRPGSFGLGQVWLLKCLRWLVCVGVVTVAPSVDAQDRPPEGTAEQAAADLSSAAFSVSKLPKTIGEDPHIVTVYDAKYVREFGFLTLHELLRTTPGFDYRNASWFENPGTRGINAAALLLIDGVPINSHLSNMFPAGRGLDLSNYKRIEAISGPGGVLWGAHSLLGVVNLISLDGADINGVFGKVRLGTAGEQLYAVRAGTVWHEVDVSIGLTLEFWRGQNVEVEGTTLASPNVGLPYIRGEDGPTTNQTSRALEAIAKLKYKGFSLYGRVPVSKKHFQVGEEGGLLAAGDNGSRQDDDWLFYLSYNRHFDAPNIGVLAKGYLYRNVQVFDNRLWSPNPLFPGGAGYSADQGLALKLGGVAEGWWNRTWAWGTVRSTLLAGVDAVRESISGSVVSVAEEDGVYAPEQPFIEDATAVLVSTYFYGDLRFLDRLGVTGGLRYNIADSYDNKMLLSGSVIGRIWRKNYIKFGIAQGMRPPTMAERFGFPPLSAPLGTYQLPDAPLGAMKPASSLAYQAELNSRVVEDYGPVDVLQMRADLAYTSVEGIRQFEPSPHTPGVSFALPRIARDIFSVEGRFDLKFKGNHQVWASYAYNRVTPATVELDGPLPQTGPRNVFSMGASVSVWRYLRVVTRANVETGVVGRVVTYEGDAIIGTPTAIEENPIVLLTAGIVVEKLFKDLELSLFAYNLLDAKYGSYPLTTLWDQTTLGARSGQPMRQIQPGVSVMLTASMTMF